MSAPIARRRTVPLRSSASSAAPRSRSPFPWRRRRQRRTTPLGGEDRTTRSSRRRGRCGASRAGSRMIPPTVFARTAAPCCRVSRPWRAQPFRVARRQTSTPPAPAKPLLFPQPGPSAGNDGQEHCHHAHRCRSARIGSGRLLVDTADHRRTGRTSRNRSRAGHTAGGNPAAATACRCATTGSATSAGGSRACAGRCSPVRARGHPGAASRRNARAQALPRPPAVRAARPGFAHAACGAPAT